MRRPLLLRLLLRRLPKHIRSVVLPATSAAAAAKPLLAPALVRVLILLLRWAVPQPNALQCLLAVPMLGVVLPRLLLLLLLRAVATARSRLLRRRTKACVFQVQLRLQLPRHLLVPPHLLVRL
jgi:hypothetical protein